MENWLISLEHLLLLQRACVCSQAPNGSSQLAVTPAALDRLASTRTACMRFTNIHAGMQTYLHIKKKINKMEEERRELLRSCGLWAEVQALWKSMSIQKNWKCQTETFGIHFSRMRKRILRFQWLPVTIWMVYDKIQTFMQILVFREKKSMFTTVFVV